MKRESKTGLLFEGFGEGSILVYPTFFLFRFFLCSDVFKPVFLERQHEERGFAEHGGGNGKVKEIDLLFELGYFGF